MENVIIMVSMWSLRGRHLVDHIHLGVCWSTLGWAGTNVMCSEHQKLTEERAFTRDCPDICSCHLGVASGWLGSGGQGSLCSWSYVSVILGITQNELILLSGTLI